MKLLILTLLVSTTAFAESASQKVNDQIEKVSSALESESAQAGNLNVLRVKSSVEAGIQIPAVSNLSVTPEIELFFTKKN